MYIVMIYKRLSAPFVPIKMVVLKRLKNLSKFDEKLRSDL